MRRRGTGLLGCRTWSLPPDDASQPFIDIHARCSEGAAASAKGFQKADLQVSSGDPSNAAPWTDVSEAQIAPFAKTCFWPADGRPHAAQASGEADICRACAKDGFGGPAPL